MNRFKTAATVWAIAFLTAILPRTGAAQTALPPSAVAAKLDEFLTRAEPFGLTGTMLLAHQGTVLLNESYGMADRERHVRLTPQTPTSIGSLSKQFTAAAVLKLVQQGKLSLTDTLGALLPDVPADKSGITLHALLTHTAGLPYLPTAMFDPGTRPEIIRDLLHEPLDPATIGKYAYSTPGYTLAAAVVERVSKQRYEDFVMRELFLPAGMTNTTFLSDTARVPVDAIHSWDGATDEGSLRGLPLFARAFGAGDVLTTTSELYKWINAVRAFTILDSARTALFLSPQVPTTPGNFYGYGWNHVRTRQGTVAIMHAGDFAGYNAELRMYTTEGYDMIFTSNARDNVRGYRTVAGDAVRRLLAGDSLPMPPRVARVAEGLGGFAGTYADSAGAGFNVVAFGGDSVRITATNQKAAAILAGSDSAAARRTAQPQSVVSMTLLPTSAASVVAYDLFTQQRTQLATGADHSLVLDIGGRSLILRQKSANAKGATPSTDRVLRGPVAAIPNPRSSTI